MGVFAQTQEVWPNEKFENDDDAVILFYVCVWYGSCHHCKYSRVKQYKKFQMFETDQWTQAYGSMDPRAPGFFSKSLIQKKSARTM